MAGLHHLADQVDMFFVLLGKWFRLWIFSSKDTLAENKECSSLEVTRAYVVR